MMTETPEEYEERQRLKRFNFSPSLQSTLDCEMKTKFSLTLPKGDGPSSAAAERGTRLHKSVENFLNKKTVQHESLDEFRTFDKIVDYLDEIFNQVTGIEVEYKKPLIENVALKGILDATLADGTIIDWKFPGKEWDDYKLKSYHNQALMYYWLTGAPKFKFVVIPTKGDVQHIEVIKPENLEREVRLWESQARNIKRMWENDSFTADPSVYKCRYCFNKHICEFAFR